MSSGRAFQSAARWANVLRPALQRSCGQSSFDSLLKRSVRAAGVMGSSAWWAQAAQQKQQFVAAQPSYGFAAQALSNSCNAADASACTESDGSSTAAPVGSSDDSECLANTEREGVIPRYQYHVLGGPPWPPLKQPPRSEINTHQQQQYPRFSPRSAALLSDRLLALSPSASLSCCTGVLAARSISLPYAAAVPAPLSYAKSYSTNASVAHHPDPPTFAHPSRPGHAVPTPHQPPHTDRLSGEEFRARHHIAVDDPDCPEPFQSFDEAGFPHEVLDVLHDLRYSAPSVIQAQAWPVAQAGRDVVAIASTGSGKTLGFLLPALMRIREQGADPASGPTALILAPTRELACQIQVEADKFRHIAMDPRAAGEGAEGARGRYRGPRGSRHLDGPPGGLRTACLYGGAARGNQYNELRRMPQLIIATPGRLLDFLESGDLSLRTVSYLVLDEADRMLDMGFEPQITQIARAMPRERQTLFFSATWPREVREIADRFARQRPVHIFIGDVQDKPVAATSITQRVQVVEPVAKLKALEDYLRGVLQPGGAQQQQQQRGGEEDSPRRVIIFCKTKAGCEHLTWQINNNMPVQAASLHGDKSQAARDYALRMFRSGRVPVLVATDVAARGLDIPRITGVVNYDMPEDIDMYVHRIGRTGRAGASGESLALVSRRDAGIAAKLAMVLEGAEQEVPDELRDLAASSMGRGGSARRGRAYGSGRGGSGSGGRGFGGLRHSGGYSGGRGGYGEGREDDRVAGRTAYGRGR